MKMWNLNISEKDIIKYKKVNYFRNTAIAFVVVNLIIYSVLNLIPSYLEPPSMSIVFFTLLTMYLIAIRIKFKKIGSDRHLYDYLYSSRFLDKIIKRNDINEARSIVMPNDTYMTNTEVKNSMGLVYSVEINTCLRRIIPLLLLITLLSLTSMFDLDGETIETVFEYGGFLFFPIFYLFGGYSVALYVIVTSNFRIQSKLKEKTINKIKNYYKLGCIDYLDCVAIEKNYGYSVLNDNLDKIDYLDILSKCNLTKEQLVLKYLDLKLKEYSDMLFLSLTLLIAFVMSVILDTGSVFTVPISAILSKYVETKVTAKRKKLLTELYTKPEKNNELFNKICSKQEYFKYCLSYILSNKPITSIFKIF